MNILIPDGPGRNVLAAIRSLGRKKHTITLAIPDRDDRNEQRNQIKRTLKNYLIKSKYCQRVINITSPLAGIEKFIEDVVELVKKNSYDVVLPFTHASVACVCYGKEKIEKFSRVPFPDFDIFMKFHDKFETVKLARRIGVPVPHTYSPKDFDELISLKDKIKYPVVIKAKIGCGVKNGLRYAKNPSELVLGYKEVRDNKSYSFLDNFEKPMIQEYIPGKIHDAVMIANLEGVVRGALTQVREITYPVSGGPGSVNRTTFEPEIIEYGKKMIKKVKWYGPLMFEFKLDSRDNSYKLLEVNPKFWGTLDLSIKAGIDFPEMACAIAKNGDVKPNFSYQVDLIYRWLMSTELLSLTQEWKKPEALRKFIQRFFIKNTIYDLSLDDIKPDIAALLFTNLKILKRKVLNFQFRSK